MKKAIFALLVLAAAPLAFAGSEQYPTHLPPSYVGPNTCVDNGQGSEQMPAPCNVTVVKPNVNHFDYVDTISPFATYQDAANHCDFSQGMVVNAAWDVVYQKYVYFCFDPYAGGNG